ncbi:MAG: hypothetical protein GF334_10330 [Candidatus Altiarchaeales archaeon]|nr:hypothetical protein [Candidatus Altiarchaeales archaeon]
MPIDYLLYTDEVEAKDIRKLVVEAFVVNENMELAKHLINAWCVARQAESDKNIPGFTGIGYDDQNAPTGRRGASCPSGSSNRWQ